MRNNWKSESNRESWKIERVLELNSLYFLLQIKETWNQFEKEEKDNFFLILHLIAVRRTMPNVKIWKSNFFECFHVTFNKSRDVATRRGFYDAAFAQLPHGLRAPVQNGCGLPYVSSTRAPWGGELWRRGPCSITPRRLHFGQGRVH